MLITVHKCTVREKTGISEVRCDTLEIITWKFIKVYNRHIRNANNRSLNEPGKICADQRRNIGKIINWANFR